MTEFVIERTCKEGETFPELDKHFGIKGVITAFETGKYKWFKMRWYFESTSATIATFLLVAPVLSGKERGLISLKAMYP